MLKLAVVRNFKRKMNPCDFWPIYAEDCTECMNKFCKEHKTTHEEYRRKKDHLNALENRIYRLQRDIMDQIRKDPKSSLISWMGDEINNLEKEIETI